MGIKYNRNAKKIVRPIIKPKKQVTIPVALADTNLELNGCKVMVAHPDPARAQKVAAEFRNILTYNIGRARVPNLGDMYRHHFAQCEKIKAGEKVFEEKQ